MDSLLGKDHFTKIFLDLIENVRRDFIDCWEYRAGLTQLIIDITKQDSHPKKCVLILCYGIKYHIIEFIDFILGGSIKEDRKDCYNYDINTLFNENYQNLIDIITEKIECGDIWVFDKLVITYDFDVSKPIMFPDSQTFLMKAISLTNQDSVDTDKQDTLIKYINLINDRIRYNIVQNDNSPVTKFNTEEDLQKDIERTIEKRKLQEANEMLKYFELKDENGKNILHYAAEKNYFTLVKYIQEIYTQQCGGDKLGLFVESTDGKYPYDYTKSLEIKHYLYKLKNDSNPRLLTLSTDKPLGTFNVFDDNKPIEVEYYTEGKHIKLQFTSTGVKLVNITSNFEFEF